MVIQPQAIDLTLRPTPLENVRAAYALLWIGESMAPVFEAGDTLLINPHLPSFPGNDVLLRKQDEATEPTACILGRLIGQTDQAYTIHEYNVGKKPRRIDRDDYPVCHRVVGKYSR
jgi:phage repressor protein C with HTH and peptisase S24 domain